MKKLLSLLKKDVILVRRNKVWTTFEVLIPVMILLLPLAFLDESYLVTYKTLQEERNSLRALSGSINEVDLEDVVPDIKLAVDGCDVPPDVDVRIYEKYVGNHTKPDRKRFAKIVMAHAKSCKPVGGVFVTSDGVDMIVPATNKDINALKMPIEPKPDDDTVSFYSYYVPYLYKTMNIKFQKDTKAAGYQAKPDKDRLKTIYIYSENEGTISFFSYVSLLIGFCITLPVINTVRTMTVERATIQPYLNSIGLSRTLFYAEHFIFATLKSTILILLAIVVYCILITRFNVFWIVFGVFVYIVASISFAMFVSAFFAKPRRAVEAITAIWLASIYFSTFSFHPVGWETIPASLNINKALKCYILAMEPHFVKDGGMSFTDGFESIREEYYSCLVYLLVMIFDAVVIGVDNSSSDLSNAEGILLGEEVVKGRKDAVSDIELSGLIKIYENGETAVNGLSMRAIRGQVSVLLGHNGCGKSTTFGMITGILQPTSGTITIEEVDAVENRNVARQSVGYCPQYNPLYDKLTVMEHLELVNTLKGKSSDDFENDAATLLRQIVLEDKRNVMAKNLSGGMKRKLSVCMAMIGGSRVVLLDEPTAGMDPGARLDVQKILNKVKEERTILLTTHYMDEAEKLGDWVFVMSHGKMAASGSLPFLKKKYGDGYVMTLVLDSDDNIEEPIAVVDQLCTAYVNDAKLKDQRGQMIEISLPENQKDRFLSLFKALEAIIDKQYDSEDLRYLSSHLMEQVKKLKIVAMGISVSSLEQVFIKVERECDRVLYGIDDDERRARAEKNFNALAEAKKEPPLEGQSLISCQLKTILYKRFVHLLKNPSQLIMQFFIPTIFLYLVFKKSAISVPADPTALIHNFNLSGFPPSKVILQFEKNSDQRIFNYLKHFKNLEVSEVPMKKKIPALVKNQTVSDKKIGLVISVYEHKTILHYYEQTSSCLPIALNLLSNLKYLRLNSSSPVGTNELYVEVYGSVLLFFFPIISFVYLVSVFIKTPTVGSTFLIFFKLTAAATGMLVYAWYLLINKDNLLIRQWYAFGLVDAGLILMYSLTKLHMCQKILQKAFSTARPLIFGFDSVYEFPAIWVDYCYFILLSVQFFWFFVAFRSRVFKRLLGGYKNKKPREKIC
ncbi:hypothetical protein L5515_013846 [Caenorhabditis briggsae]|uniref:ABC transporter domain-containing protein n=1 Tax=Caenorhabditis briggsae TaxID=6238 RepID=A0AAE9E9E2_CAEBR|nr:hypothetical protein L5515_013846 [Caenorhabditis briggsae]